MPGELFEANLWVVNDYYEEYRDVTYICNIMNAKGEIQYTKTVEIDITENSSDLFFNIDWEVTGIEGEYFEVELELKDGSGMVLSDNKYRILIMDQEKARLEAYKLNQKMTEAKNKYGLRGYYKFAPELLDMR